MIEDILPPEAWKILQSDPGAVLLDVRSKVEFNFVGHPPGAVNVPWQEAPEWKVDPQFVEKVRDALKARGLEKPEDGNILAMCRSGARSRSAGEALAALGFKHVVNVAEGFEGDLDGQKHRGNVNGWRFHGLPWEQT